MEGHRPNPPRSNTPLFIIGIVAALLIGLWLGGHSSVLPDYARDLFVKDTPGQRYDEAVNRIANDYYRKVDKNKLLDTSLAAAVKSLGDQYSAYFDAKAYKAMQLETSGRFEGIGVTIEPAEGGLIVRSVVPNSPAEKGGLKPGAVITEVNDKSLRGLSPREATALITGAAGTKVRLTINYRGATRKEAFTREKVKFPVVRSQLKTERGKKIGHVALAGFVSGAGEQVRTAVEKKLKQGAKGIVLDLRNNPGGLVSEAVSVSSVFIPKNKTVVKTRERSGDKEDYKSTGNPISSKIPMVVLVNGNTVSAAEIVSGALQDYKRATVVGEHTYGKGVFQEVSPLAGGAGIELTVGEYFTPKGRNLGGGGVKQGAGIIPDVKVKDVAGSKKDEALALALRTVADKSK